MNNSINARDIKDNVSIVDLLARLGYKPFKKSGTEHIYLSMLRDSDTTPSFSVNDKLGCWYDHGEGKGGNVIDFGLRYWRGATFQEVLEKITHTMDFHVAEVVAGDKPKRKRLAVKQPHYQVLEIKELGNNAAITAYLQSRRIWPEAQGRLKEIYYYVEDEQKNRKNFFAAGWQNELGAWEVRNIHFKGCIGHKAISFIPRDPENLAVFEGFLNYLSWISENPLSNESVMILNSLSLIQSGISKAKDFKQITLWFDLDEKGREATNTFCQAISHARDCSLVYFGYNDYNEKIVAQPNGMTITR
ncbi:MAG: toprim domain-containing protein [Bacteroidetes bacterium]|nr:toprim domain-containing protein [Bacteroidota bacterium]